MPNEAPAVPATTTPSPDATTILAAATDGGTAKPSGAPTAPADGVKPDAGNPDPSKPADPNAKPNEKPAGAPEKYAEFKLPDGLTLNPQLAEKFTSVAKELNLSQEAAQKLVDLQTESVSKSIDQQKADFEAMRTQWKAETKKALGANETAELAFAAKARSEFVSAPLLKLLNETGLGDHPEVVKLFVRLGKSVAEDGLPEGKGADPKAEKRDPAEVLYGNSK